LADRLSRREVLVSAAVVAVAAGLAAEGENGPATPKTQALRRAAAKPTPPPSPKPVPASSRPTPGAPVMNTPVFTLAEYRSVVPGPAYPAHAVALTIDDGPHPVWTPKVLALLDRYHVPATFCLIGNQVRGHESVARSVVNAGHHVANHTYNHPTSLSTYPAERVRDEIDKAQDKIYSATGYQPKLFRPPGGAWSAPMMAQTAQAGLVSVDWSDDPRDWTRPGTGLIVSRMMAARPGQILLCHDGGGDRSETYEALQTVIPALQAKGYLFVSL
jgi:peptidoglycan/xylan/chitin deacetylase (PgdA/CDA1 family)